MDYVITVAHGTTFRLRLLELLRAVFWPRTWRRWLAPRRTAWELRERTTWLKRTSALRAALAALGATDGDRVRVYPFFWSGRNGVVDRTHAAARLQRKVEARLARLPDARHFVIAHSHGGNVALYALRDSAPMAASLAGLVCLSTPFLHVRRRDLRDVADALLWSGGVMTLLAVAGLWYASPEHWVTRNGWASIATGVVAVALLAILGATLRKFADQVLRDASLPEEHRVPVLTIRAPADEASITLAAAEFLLWTANALWTHPWRLIRAVNERVRAFFDAPHETTFAQAGVFWVLLSSTGWLWWRGGPSADAPLSLLAALVVAAAVAALAGALVCFVGAYVWGPLLVLLWPAAALCLWPFGGRLAMAAPFLEVHVGWSPPGRSEATLLTRVSADGGLAHSASYTDPRALDIVVAWLRARSGPEMPPRHD